MGHSGQLPSQTPMGQDPARPFRPQQEMRVFLGFAVQPLVTAIVALILFPAIALTDTPLIGAASANPFSAAIGFAVVTGVTGFLVMAFAAIPLFSWLSNHTPLTRGVVLTAGAVLGNLPTGIILVIFLARYGLSPAGAAYGPFGLLRTLIIGSLIGLSGAAAFWHIAGDHLGPDEADQR